jgi:hypothetical protein
MYNALLNTTGTFGGFLSGVNEVRDLPADGCRRRPSRGAVGSCSRPGRFRSVQRRPVGRQFQLYRQRD